MTRPDQRKRLWVEPAVQGGLVRRLVYYWLISLWALVCVAAGVPYVTQWLLHGVAPPLAETVAGAVLRCWPLLAAGTAVLPLLLWDAYRYTHRVAGPLLRLKQSLRDLAAGETPAPLTFRRGEPWAELAAEFNAVRGYVLELRAQALAADVLRADAPSRDAAPPGEAAPPAEPVSRKPPAADATPESARPARKGDTERLPRPDARRPVGGEANESAAAARQLA